MSLYIGYYMVILPTNVNTHTNYMNLLIVKELPTRLEPSKDGQLYLSRVFRQVRIESLTVFHYWKTGSVRSGEAHYKQPVAPVNSFLTLLLQNQATPININ